MKSNITGPDSEAEKPLEKLMKKAIDYDLNEYNEFYEVWNSYKFRLK